MIFNQEIKDGLGDQIFDRLTFSAKANMSKPTLTQLSDDQQDLLRKVTAKANPDQLDLYYLDAILVSIGWNKNDDIFDKDETWAARNTPVDKQFNYMHDEKDIIGHITSSQVIDENNNLFEGDTPPDKFHILVQSVIYNHWSDEFLQERINKIFSEIESGKWFVSMECLFPHFDYGVITPDGQQKVIARSEDTAFLTKHLRRYGGTGEYKGHKIGRLLRNFTFSGKGLVDEPANPDSIILSSVQDFSGTKASIKILGKNMTEELQTLTKQLEDAKAENKALADKIAGFEKQNFESTIAGIKAENDTLKNDVDSLKTTIAELQVVIISCKKECDDKEEMVAQSKESVVALQKDLAEAKLEIEQAKAEKITSDRVNKLVLSGVEEAEAKAIASKFTSTSDEIFVEVLKAYAKTSKADATVTVADITIETEDVVLENATAAVDDTVDGKVLEKTKASIINFLSKNLQNKGGK